VAPAELISAVVLLREQLRAARLHLPTGDSQAAQEIRARAIEQIDDYLLPRLRSLDAPLLVVVGGSTGSGKSTLVNSLIGHPVSQPGVLRPTTRHPVLAHHPNDEAWFMDDRVLPRLPRITGPQSGPLAGAEEMFGLRLVARPEVPAGLVLLDAPDIDSVARANRDLAGILMAAADLWIFVTTAARYADAVPWHALRGAVARNAAVALVLNRVPPEAVKEVSVHLRSLLAAEGLGSAPLFIVTESALTDSMIPRELMEPVSQWLAGLAADATTRAAIARRTLDGAFEALVAESYLLSDAVDDQVAAAARLRAMVDPAFDLAARRLRAVSEDGSLLRGEVLARWQEFVGAGETFRKLESTVSRWRDRISASFHGEPAPPERVVQAIETGLAQVLVSEVTQACEQVDAAWRADAAGLVLLGGADLARPAADTQSRAGALVHAWQSDVLGLIREEGADRRTTARALAYGVNGIGLTLMVLVFSSTGGITGAEVGIAGGSTVLAQKVLEAVFSEDAVRRMSGRAREMLAGRVAGFLAESAAVFTSRLEALGLDPQAGSDLRLAAATVAQSRLDAPEPVELPLARPLPAAPEPVVPAQTGWRESLRRWWRAGADGGSG
jgi:hypothetical protein